MTHSDPIPSNDNNSYDLDSELQAMTDAEKIEDIEFNEQGLKRRQSEDMLIAYLVNDGFPLLPQILEARAKFHEEFGPTEAYYYDRFADNVLKFLDDLATPDTSSEIPQHDYEQTYLHKELVCAIQGLALGYDMQVHELRFAREHEENGDIINAENLKSIAYETRKDSEAEVLTNDLLGTELATRLLTAVAPAFEGDSLLPLTPESEEYIMMYRLGQEKMVDDRKEVRTYTSLAREILETKVTSGQTEHPEFNNFANYLCLAVARTILEPKHTASKNPDQIDIYKTLIDYNVTAAIEIAPQIGFEPVDIQIMYDDILAQLSNQQ